MASSDSKEKQTKFANRYSVEDFEQRIVALYEKEDASDGLNINHISKQLGINRNTVSKWLKALESKNIIVSRKVGVSYLYFKVDQIFPGPYILRVEFEDDNLMIVGSNETYLTRIGEKLSSLMDENLFKFYPFSLFDSEEKKSFINDIKTSGMVGFEKELILKKQDDKTETYSFKVDSLPKNQYSFSITFEDLTLLKLQREQFLTSDSVKKILDLFTESFISIQTPDHKVLMANKKTIDELNKGKELSSEPLYCYQLYREKDSECSGCIAKKALESGSSASTDYLIGEQKCTFQAIPIDSNESKLKGYILVSRD